MTTADDTTPPTSIRESGAFLMIGILLLTAPAVISLGLHHHEVIAKCIAVCLILAALPFSSLHIVVRNGRLRAALGGLITVRHVALADIASVRRFRPPGLDRCSS
jgi:hypothetical protein